MFSRRFLKDVRRKAPDRLIERSAPAHARKNGVKLLFLSITTLVLLSIQVSLPKFVGLSPYQLYDVGNASPSAEFPFSVTVTYDATTEKILFADHTDSLGDGNWIELAGGTSIEIPQLTLRYEGVTSETYVRDGRTIKIESDFTVKQVTYPLTQHPVYFQGDSVTANFHGSSLLAGGTVDFRLIKTSPLGVEYILNEAYEGKLTPLRNLIAAGNAVWIKAGATLDSTGDHTATFTAPGPGDYVLFVVKETTAPSYELRIYSATMVEVLDYGCNVTAPPSVTQGASVDISIGLVNAQPSTTGYRYGAVMVHENAYDVLIKLETNATTHGTNVTANGALLLEGTKAPKKLWIAGVGLGSLDSDIVRERILQAIDADKLSLSFTDVTTGTTASLSLMTDETMSTGRYILLVGTWEQETGKRVVAFDQRDVRLKAPAPPPPPPPPRRPPKPPPNKSPVAEAGSDRRAFVDRTVDFDGSASYDPDGTIVSYSWSFGDNATASGVTVSHIYASEGVYTANLTVTDDDGATASDNVTVTVEALPLPPEAEVEESVGANETRHVVDAVDEADTAVTVNTTAPVTVLVLSYPSNPYPDVPLPPGAVPKYVDVSVSNPDAVSWPIYVEQHYTDEEISGLDESSLGIYYYKDGSWHRCRETGVYPERNIVWARMYRDEVVGVPIIMGGVRVAAFEVSELSVTPSQVEAGEAVTVSVKVSNVGDESGSYTVTLSIHGEFEDTETVTLDGGASETVSFTVVKDEIGVYPVEVDGLRGSFTVVAPPAPAEFRLSDLTVTPFQVEPGETVNVSIKVHNVGEMSGSYLLALKMNGYTVETEPVTLDGGKSTTVSFTVSTTTEGSHTIDIDALSGTFTVVALAPPPKPFPWIYVIIALAIVAVIVTYLFWKRKI